MLDYKLNPLNVTIREVLIGNKKLTKSIFNQIESRGCFNNAIEFIGDDIIGYVKVLNDRYLLWTKDGKLRKSRLNDYYNLNEDIERASIKKQLGFYKKQD